MINTELAPEYENIKDEKYDVSSNGITWINTKVPNWIMLHVNVGDTVGDIDKYQSKMVTVNATDGGDASKAYLLAPNGGWCWEVISLGGYGGTQLKKNGMEDWLTFFAVQAGTYEIIMSIYESATGGLSSSGNLIARDTITITVLANYEVTYNVVNENGNIYADTLGVTIGNADSVPLGTTVKFTAVPKPGYQVKQWSTGETTETIAVRVISDTLVKVEFEPIRYNITFNAKGGEFSADKDTMMLIVDSLNLESTTPISNIPAKDSYRFVKWASKEGVEANLKNITSDTVFFATWIKLLTVTFNTPTNGTLTADSNNVSIGASPATLDSASFITFTATPSVGYQIKQWTTSNNELINYRNKTYEVKLLSDTIVNVEFEAIKYSITFDANGGMFSANSSLTIVVDSLSLATAKFDSVPTQSGYQFAGWWTSTVGGDSIDWETITSDTAFFAKWNEIPTPLPDSADLTLSAFTLSVADDTTVNLLNGDTVLLRYDYASITIAATPADGRAAVSGDTGVQALKVGRNRFTITLTDTFYLCTRSYSVVVFRLPADTAAAIADFAVANDSAVTVTTLDTAIASAEMRDSIQKRLFDTPNSIVFEKPISLEDTVSVAHAGCAVDSIRLSITDLEGKLTPMVNSLRNGENIIKLGGSYELRVYKSLDTAKSIRKKFGTLTFVNNPSNNGVGERFESFQWYRNGEAIAGGTGQYYVLPKDDDPLHRYTVSVTHASGWLVSTCPSSNALPPAVQPASLSVFPNPAPAGSRLSIAAKGLSAAPVSVEVYDMKGTLVRSAGAEARQPEAIAPAQAGTYVIHVRQGGRVVGSRVVIVKQQ
jgi:hypothetical protein